MKKIYNHLRLMAVAILFLCSTGANSQSNPVAVDDTASVKKHYSIDINVLRNDYDPDGDSLIISETGWPVHGTAQTLSNEDSIIRYECSTYSGKDSLWYKVTKKHDANFYAVAWVVVEVIPNELPQVYNTPQAIVAGNTVEFNIHDVAYDPDGDDYEFEKVYDPEHGEADELSDTTFWITITQNYDGMDSSKVRLQEGLSNGLDNYSYLKLEVSPNPEYPWANNDTMTVLRGDTAVFHVLENDNDQQNNQLIIEDVDLESGMNCQLYEWDENTVTIVPRVDAITGVVKYFTYQAKEQENELHLSNWASGYLQVLPNPNLPVAYNDTVNVVAGFEIEIHPLENDFDPNEEPLEINSVRKENGNMVYTYGNTSVLVSPLAYSSGQMRLSYLMSEINNTYYNDIGKIILQVQKNENPPVAINDTVYMNAYDSITIYPIENDLLPQPGSVLVKEIQYEGLISQVVSIQKDSTDESRIIMQLKSNYSGELCFNYNFYYPEQPGMISNFAQICVMVEPDPDSLLAVGDEFVIDFFSPVEGYNLLANDQIPVSDTIENIIHSTPPDFQGIDINSAGLFYLQPSDFVYGNYQLYYYIRTEQMAPKISSFARIKVSVANLHRTDSLHINNINAGFSSFGNNFWDDRTENRFMKFEVLKGSGKISIFNNSFWIGGINNNSLHLAAERYRQQGKDFWTGPISETYTNEDIKGYRVWKLNKDDIDYHITHYKDPDYEPIESIATWPGNGNPELGQAEQLAPYFDQNNDQQYNPLDGDFPLIRGDQSLFFIFNDGADIHTETNGEPMNVEIHGNAYAFDQPDDSALNNTVFLHYDIYNRSENTYHDTYTGFFNDFDLGWGWDDYIGTDVSRGLTYVYNGVPVDGSGEPQAYGENPPVQGMTILGGPTMAADNLDNPAGGCDESINGLNFGDGIIDNERLGMTQFSSFNNTSANPNTTDPQIAPEYYNYMTGKWKDNSPLFYGGTGHINDPQTVGPECRFMYPGASDPLNWGTGCEYPDGGFNQNGYYWDESTVGNEPGDRRGVSITGPFTFAPGDVQSLDVAFVYARDNDTTDQHSAIDIMNQRIDTIRNRVMNGGIIYMPTYSVGITEHQQTPFDVSVYPNPARGNSIRIMADGSQEKNLQMVITDLLGRNIIRRSITGGEINTLDISQLQNGIYVLTIKNKNSTVNRKLVIRR